MADTTVTQLVRDYRKMATLMNGGLPERVIEMLGDTSRDVLLELAEAPASTWQDFSEKVAVLIGALPADPLPGWLARIRDSFADDLRALPARF